MLKYLRRGSKEEEGEEGEGQIRRLSKESKGSKSSKEYSEDLFVFDAEEDGEGPPMTLPYFDMLDRILQNQVVLGQFCSHVDSELVLLRLRFCATVDKCLGAESKSERALRARYICSTLVLDGGLFPQPHKPSTAERRLQANAELGGNANIQQVLADLKLVRDAFLDDVSKIPHLRPQMVIAYRNQKS
ncbi:hypothetical protein BASA81_006454 [Batrachochytrium salamandrivorans]|nr:hypothetical protein BASA81_006454 [Batrachochytrium salamandrivorans]